MTELTQQILELSQQHIAYFNIGISLIIAALVIFLGGAILIASLCLDFTRENIIMAIIAVLAVGCLVAGVILIVKAKLLTPQIEMLKYQLDNVISILPMK